MDDPRGQDITPRDAGLKELIFKKVIKAGPADDKPCSNDEVLIHYVGRLPGNEEAFDSSRERGTPFKFQIGAGKVVKGYDVLLPTMNVGETASVTLAPKYAFGSKGADKVPPNSDVEFEVELLSYCGQDITKARDGGVLKSTRKVGNGYVTPHNNADVTLNIKCWCGDRLVEDKRHEFVLTKSGGGQNPKLLTEGAILGLGTMRDREVSRITVGPRYAFGEAGCSDFDIPADAVLVYELDMVSFQNEKKVYEMSFEARMEGASQAKAEGTEQFKAANYKLALKSYRRGVDLTDGEQVFKPEDQQQEMSQLRLLCHLNCAASALKLKEWGVAEDACSKVLVMDADNVKALYRRGEASMGLSNPDGAIKDLQHVLKIEPGNKQARQRLQQATEMKKTVLSKERNMYSSIFSRMAKDVEAQPAPQPNLFEEAQARLEAEKAAQLAKVMQAEEQQAAASAATSSAP